jgi:hypothetical protein
MFEIVSKIQMGNWLDRLESMIDVEHWQRSQNLQKKAFQFQEIDHIPTVINYPLEPEEWPSFNYIQTVEDPAAMLLNELESVYMGAKLKDDRLYGIRANFGTGIIASMFGCEIRVFEKELPLALPLSPKAIDGVMNGGISNGHTGLFQKVCENIDFFKTMLSQYDKLSHVVDFELFDIQGTFDNAAIMLGSEIFTKMYDEEEKVIKFLESLAETITWAVLEQRKLDGFSEKENGGWINFAGGLCLRYDSCVNIRGEHFCKFVKPVDLKLLSRFGGWAHFCGNAQQWWRYLLDIPGLKAINPFQGNFYDLSQMYSECRSAKVAIVNWTTPVGERCRQQIRTGFSRFLQVDSFSDACRAKEQMLSHMHADGYITK